MGVNRDGWRVPFQSENFPDDISAQQTCNWRVRQGQDDLVAAELFRDIQDLENDIPFAVNPMAEGMACEVLIVLCGILQYGTLGYLAPERIRDPADADIRGEVYAVGAIGYFLLTGEVWMPSLESGTPVEAPPIGARRKLATPGLEAAIAKALRYRKPARWESCRALSGALENCRPKQSGE